MLISATYDASGQCRTYKQVAGILNLALSQDAIALSWIKERAEKQHAGYRPADLNLREAWAEYLSYQHGEHWTPRQSYLVRRISALLG